MSDAASQDARRSLRMGGLYLLVLAAIVLVHRVHAPRDPRRIVLTRAEVEARTAAEADLRGRALTEREGDVLLRTIAEERVLGREAVLRRLDRGDPLIRGPLLGHAVRELAGDVAAPTEAEVRAHFDADPDRYSISASVSLELVTLPVGATDEEAARILKRLQAGASPEAFAAVPGVPPRQPRLTRRDLVGAYGRSFADAVEAMQDGAWHGPLASKQGTHVVRVMGREPPRSRSFDQVRRYVREDLEGERLRARAAVALEALRERYDIRAEGDGS